MEPFLNVTDFLLLLLWVRLWSLPEQELYFNPFLSAPTRVIDQVLDFLRPVLPLPERVRVLIVLTCLLAFRAITRNYFRPEVPWEITLGEIFHFSPQASGVRGALTFSLLHFGFFVANYWGVYVLIQIVTSVLRRDRASEVFHFAALPLSALHRRWAQILLLLAVHGVLVYELSLVGFNLQIATVEAPPNLIFLGGLILLSVADLLMMAWQLMFALLMGSLVATLLQNHGLNLICNEGIATLLGTRKRFMIGVLDLTPLLYMMSLYVIYQALRVLYVAL